MRRHIAFSVLVVAALAGFIFLALRPALMGRPHTARNALPMTHVTIGKTSIAVEVAATQEEREQGLSGRAGLAAGTGMLFVFEQPSMVGFWMKDMRFPLDIIWADAAGTIVTVDRDISPDTYPQAFYPAKPARWVLEVPAGFAQAHRIAIGQKIVVQ